jgi:hypothetical protein
MIVYVHFQSNLSLNATKDLGTLKRIILEQLTEMLHPTVPSYAGWKKRTTLVLVCPLNNVLESSSFITALKQNLSSTCSFTKPPYLNWQDSVAGYLRTSYKLQTVQNRRIHEDWFREPEKGRGPAYFEVITETSRARAGGLRKTMAIIRIVDIPAEILTGYSPNTGQ